MNFLQTIAASGIGFIIAKFLGGLFDSYVTKNNEALAQRKADEQALLLMAYEVRDIGVSYWSTDENNVETGKMEAALQGRLQYIGKLVEELFGSDDQLRAGVNIELLRFDEAITYGKFRGSDRSADLGRCAEIETTCYSFTHKVSSATRKLKRPLFALN